MRLQHSAEVLRGGEAGALASIKKPVGYNAIQYLKEHAPGFLERLTVRNRNRTYHRFWQAGPGHDANLYDLKTIYNAIEYIHNNPVRRGLVAAVFLVTAALLRAGLVFLRGGTWSTPRGNL